jgi:hypothetical protein
MTRLPYCAMTIWRYDNSATWTCREMAKPPTRYGAPLKLRALEPEIVPASEPIQPADLVARRRPMESKSDPTVLYLHPDGKYELKRFALARGPKVKVHDLLMEAIEEWAQRHGLAGPFRVPSERPRKM